MDSILVNVVGVQRTPTALYLADGRLQGVVTPTGIPEADRSAIANIQGKSYASKEVAEGCQVQFKVGPDGWEGVVEDSKACVDELEKANKLGPGSRKLLGQHPTSTNKPTSDLINNLKKQKGP